MKAGTSRMNKIPSLALLLAISASSISLSCLAAYSNLAWSTFDDDGTRVYDTNNIVKAAIERNRFIPLRYDREFILNSQDLFKEIHELGQFELNAYANSSLVSGIKMVVGEFACASYRHYNKLPEAKECNGIYADKRTIEGMPFQDGQFISNRITATVNNISTPSRSYDIYLPSVNEKPLTSFWGAVHELGSFFVNIDKSSTVLKVYVDAYKLTKDGERGSKVTPKEQVVIVIIPNSRKIGKRYSEKDAKNYAIGSSMLLVPIYTNSR